MARDSGIEPLRKFVAKLKPYWRGIAARLRWPIHTGQLEGIDNVESDEENGLWIPGQRLFLSEDQSRVYRNSVKHLNEASVELH